MIFSTKEIKMNRNYESCIDSVTRFNPNATQLADRAGANIFWEVDSNSFGFRLDFDSRESGLVTYFSKVHSEVNALHAKIIYLNINEHILIFLHKG